MGPHWAALPHGDLSFPQRIPLETRASQMAIQSAAAPSAHAEAPHSYREHNAVLDPYCGDADISTMVASTPTLITL